MSLKFHEHIFAGHERAGGVRNVWLGGLWGGAGGLGAVAPLG